VPTRNGHKALCYMHLWGACPRTPIPATRVILQPPVLSITFPAKQPNQPCPAPGIVKYWRGVQAGSSKISVELCSQFCDNIGGESAQD
jgi:hypothetical protein